MNYEICLVLNSKFGGFSLNDEMALWLKKERGWTIINSNEYSYENKDSYDVTTLLKLLGGMYISATDNSSIKFRSHQDLIDCVLHFRKVHENDTYPDSHYHKIHDFEIVKATYQLSIENYYDGKEKVNNDCFIEEL